MYCCYCGGSLDRTDYCPECHHNVAFWKKTNYISNYLYNIGLECARERDLSGAKDYLELSLKYNKRNIAARNLLGLVQYAVGEPVEAIVQWTISRDLYSKDNPAREYLTRAQDTSAKIEHMNQTVRKYNQVLFYLKHGNEDLAMIQIKKIVETNPSMVSAHLLYALLCMKNEDYAQAMKTLKEAEEVDRGNPDIRLYKKECSYYVTPDGRARPHRRRSREETAKEQEESKEKKNPFLRFFKFSNNNPMAATVINLVIGVAIGAAVVGVLVIPSVRQQAAKSTNSNLLDANESLSSDQREINSLNETIDELNEQLESEQTKTDAADQTVDSYKALLNAYEAYAQAEYSEAAEDLDGVDSSLLDSDALAIYETMLDTVSEQMLEEYYSQGMSYYRSAYYSDAITMLKKVVKIDESYDDYKAAFYLAAAFQARDKDSNAKKWYQLVVDNSSDTEYQQYAQESIDEIDGVEEEADEEE